MADLYELLMPAGVGTVAHDGRRHHDIFAVDGWSEAVDQFGHYFHHFGLCGLSGFLHLFV